MGRYVQDPGTRRTKCVSDTENVAGVFVEPPKRRQTSKTAQNAEEIRQRRVQKNQQQLKRYFELLRLKNQRDAILQQSREMRDAKTPTDTDREESTPPPQQQPPQQPAQLPTPDANPTPPPTPPGEEWSVENPTKHSPEQQQQPAEQVHYYVKYPTFTSCIKHPSSILFFETLFNPHQRAKVQLRQSRPENRKKGGDDRRLYTIYDTEDDTAPPSANNEEKPRRSKNSGYRSEGGNRSDHEKTEISKEWLAKIKKRRQAPPVQAGSKYIDYGPIDGPATTDIVSGITPQVKEAKPRRNKSSLSEDELLTRGHSTSCNLLNKDLRSSERRLQNSGYSTDAGPQHRRHHGRSSSGYQSDGPARHRSSQRNKDRPTTAAAAVASTVETKLSHADSADSLEDLHSQVEEVEKLVAHKMGWRGAVQDLDYFDQEIRLLERRNVLIEKLRREEEEVLRELEEEKVRVVERVWKAHLKVDNTMSENSPGYLSALYKEGGVVVLVVNRPKRGVLVETDPKPD
eukprot:sb/3479479/